MKGNKMEMTKNQALSSVDEKFYELKNNKKIALMPFIMAGDPNIEKTSEILLRLQENGADLIELGIPYSDPFSRRAYYSAICLSSTKVRDYTKKSN